MVTRLVCPRSSIEGSFELAASSLLSACSNNASLLHHFFNTTTFTVYVTACRGREPSLENSYD